MQEVLLVAEIKSLEKLFHQRRYVAFAKRNKAGLEQSHQIMIHVFEHQIERTYQQGNSYI